MKDYSVYFPSPNQKGRWGVNIRSGGFTRIERGEHYPSRGHPQAYTFSWERGRSLEEYQLVFISRGRGEVEVADEPLRSCEAPFCFLLKPGVWHRYRPDAETGWIEHWLGFEGSLLEFFGEGSLPLQAPRRAVGIAFEVERQFSRIHELLQEQQWGFQELLVGRLLQLLTQLDCHERYPLAENDPWAGVVREACAYMAEHIGEAISIEELARRLNVGYSMFRRVFKQRTSLSPKQYLLSLRLERVKRHLLEGRLAIAAIALGTGFDSPSHLANQFKKATGFSPRDWGKRQTSKLHDSTL